jgi:aryl-alcohol dehydrogenase-like predicted oxidoreductase
MLDPFTHALHPTDPGRTAVGTWSGGRFLHFGEALDDERFVSLIRPDKAINTIITADVHGAGNADKLVARAIAHGRRRKICVIGAVGLDFYSGERLGIHGFPRFTDPRLRGPRSYGDYLSMATESSLERCGIDRFDLLLLHSPDPIGYTSEVVWREMAALREAGLARMIGVAPGSELEFSTDALECFARFGGLMDWALIKLSPLEPMPGELYLHAAVAAQINVISRICGYGGLGIDRVLPEQQALEPIARRAGLTMLQLACQWNLSHEAVSCVVPTLVQETGPGARPVEQKRAELAALPADVRLSPADLEAIAAVGDGARRSAGHEPLVAASPHHLAPA